MTHNSKNHLLSDPRFNKGTAFSYAERRQLGLLGRLPPRVETISEQAERVMTQIRRLDAAIDRFLLLQQLFATNTILFFKVVDLHLRELLPIIYTPTVGEGVMQFSRNFVRQQGLIISYRDIDRLDEIFADYSGEDIDIAVVTDGEGVLGIGDQGVGGLNIAIGKLMVYTACAGINPFRTLPIQLDFGTNNPALLDDPLYLGLRENRVNSEIYYDFMEKFVVFFKNKFKTTFLHWEDFGKDNARKVLELFRKRHPSFNDDIQGTGAITLAAVLGGMKKSGIDSAVHKFCIFGAGTAGTGIADQICQALARSENKEVAEIRKRFFLIDRHGLIRENGHPIADFQKPYARSADELAGWRLNRPGEIFLADVVKNAGITVLIGCSTAAGAFTPEIIEQMARNSARPVIMPLSNPTNKAEATPEQILQHSQGTALIATGSPFSPVIFQGKKHVVSQCNNALVYPGIALGMLISQSPRLTDQMLLAAGNEVAGNCNDNREDSRLLPDISDAKKLSQAVALAVARCAIAEGIAPAKSDDELKQILHGMVWYPEYD